MKKIFKYLTLSAIIFAVAVLFGFSFKTVNADGIATSNKIEIAGVQVSYLGAYDTNSTGQNGIRFIGSYKKYTPASGYSIKNYGVLLAYGTAEANDSFVIGATINDKSVENFYSINLSDSENGYLYANLNNIPAAFKGQMITARAYVQLTDGENDSYVYSSTVRTDCLADACRKIYNQNADDAECLTTSATVDSTSQTNMIKMIANTSRVKVTSSSGDVTYYADGGYNSGDSNYKAFTKGDTVELIRGEYNYGFEIKSDCVLIGANYNVPLTTAGVRDYTGMDSHSIGETILKVAPSTFASSSSNFTLNGVKVEATNAFIFAGTSNKSNTNISYNNFSYSDANGIKSTITLESGTPQVSNLVIENNYFKGSASASADIFFDSTTVSTININNNVFDGTNGTEANENDYAIYIGAPAGNKQITITNNKFNHLDANYQILVGNNLSSAKAYSINISNNNLSFNGSGLLGNGIRCNYLGNASKVDIIHNTNFRVNRYFNAIVLAPNASVKETTSSNSPTINIMYNHFYSAKTVTQPTARTSKVNTQFVRITIVLKEASSFANTTIFSNYYNGTFKEGAYANLSSASGTTLTVSGSVNNAYPQEYSSSGSTSVVNNNYNLYLALQQYQTELSTYKVANPGFIDDKDAWYGGNDANNILDYIPSFAEAYGSKFEIQTSTSGDPAVASAELVYVGSDNQEKAVCELLGITTGNNTVVSKYSALYSQQEALKAVAIAFKNQGTQIEYDETLKRRMVNIAPEVATSYNHAILDCSSFVNAVYYNAFGQNILDSSSISTDSFTSYASKNQSNADVLYYVDNSNYYGVDNANKVANTGAVSSDIANYYNSTEIATLLDGIWKNLQIGDLVVYRKYENAGGHVMMYMGNDTFYHCTGASFYLDETNLENSFDRLSSSEASKGAIQTLSAKNLFTLQSTSGRYLFQEAIEEFCVLRPLNQSSKEWNITSITEKRVTNPNLVVELSSNPNNNSSVTIGQEISYILAASSSDGKSISNITLVQYIPTGITFDRFTNENSAKRVTLYDDSDAIIKQVTGTTVMDLSDVEKANVKKIVWTVSSLSSNVSRGFIGTVNNSLAAGTKITTSANINDIPANQLTHVVKNSTDLSGLKNNITALSETYTVNDFLDAAYGYDVLPNTVANMAYGFYENITNNNYYLTDSYAYKGLVANNLYGGTIFDKLSTGNNSPRVRRVETDYLENGDIIVVMNKTGESTYSYQAYIFVRYTESDVEHIALYGIDGDGNVVEKVSSRSINDTFETITTDEYHTTEQYIEQLEANYLFVVYRPSIN